MTENTNTFEVLGRQFRLHPASVHTSLLKAGDKAKIAGFTPQTKEGEDCAFVIDNATLLPGYFVIICEEVVPDPYFYEDEDD